MSCHTRVTRLETALPLSDSCRDIPMVQFRPYLNYPMFQLIDIRYVCLVHILLHDTPERIVSTQQDLSRVGSDTISQVV